MEGGSERLLVAWLSYGPIKGVQPIMRQPAHSPSINENLVETADSQGNSEKDFRQRALAALATPRAIAKKAEPGTHAQDHDRYGEFDSAAGAPGKMKPDTSPVAAKKSSANLGERVREFLSIWKQAWESKDLDEFIKMYHPNFKQREKDLSEFKRTKQNFFKEYKIIRVELDKISAKKLKYGLRVRFLQSFRGDDYSDKGWKTMVLAEGKDRGFRIISEEWRSLDAPPSDS
jgi:hypothetical protein